MTTVISVRFRHAGKLYFFAPGELEIRAGEHVIVETARGIEYAEVRIGNHDVEDDAVTPPLKEVIRIATPEDTAHEADNREKEKEAFSLCKQKIGEKALEMKLIYCEYTFDNSKILFYFTADGRVDFRDLVKELAGVFRTRIELRQVGVRDETKLLGGLGSCGRPLCCATFLNDFAPVSIKMAKEQNLSLNPVKISGVCGRLMCCLGNEEEVYEELNKKLPGVGDLVDLADGSRGEVQSIGILKQLVKVVVELPGDEKEVREYPAEDVTVRVRRRDKNRMREAAERTEREQRKERERLEKYREKTGEASASAASDNGAAEGNTPAGETGDTAAGEKKERRERRDRRDRGGSTGRPGNSGRGRAGEGSEGSEGKETRGHKGNRESGNTADGSSGNAEDGGKQENRGRRDRRDRGGNPGRSGNSGRGRAGEGGEGGENRGYKGNREGGNTADGNPENGGGDGEKKEHRERRYHHRRKGNGEAQGAPAGTGGEG